MLTCTDWLGLDLTPEPAQPPSRAQQAEEGAGYAEEKGEEEEVAWGALIGGMAAAEVGTQ